MKIYENDAKNLKRLHVSTLLDLALIIPHSFEDTTIIQSPQNGQVGAIEVEIKSIATKSSFLLVSAYCINWQKGVNFMIFHPKPFHYATFKIGKKMFVLGKVEFAYGKWQIIQPKIVTKTNTIIPRYKTPLKNPTVINLIKNYVSENSLIQSGLDEKNAKILYSLHVGDKNSVNMLSERNFEQTTLPTLKYAEIVNYLQKMSKKKRDFPATSMLDGDESEFVNSLEFTLTDDQKNAIKDIKADFLKPTASKRVIMGDVGCGKTMVIFASVMLAYPKKSILMAPTTILATQIYEEAKKLLHVKTCLVTNRDKNRDLSQYDFIIGTHALLYRELPKCDLVMIDEQHRFGTNQRKLIHSLVSKGKKHPHFLQFTATPIPRTMSLINATVVEYSFIKQMPFKKDISTFVINKSDFKALLSHIDSEIEKSNQIIVIYPLIEESDANIYQSLDEGRAFWENRYKNVHVTHGKDKEKESVLKDFRDNGDILLATTVVEVGISLPRLSTIVIVGAEKLGMASLHQLRGRVSRTGLKGYCYLFSYSDNTQRLKDFAKTKSGFEIAELDLKYRQGGDILNGLIQHGVQFKYFDMKEDREILEKAKNTLQN